jgi:hypothetical protein
MKLLDHTVLTFIACWMERLISRVFVSWQEMFLAPAFPPLQDRLEILLLVSASTVSLISTAVTFSATSPKATCSQPVAR